MADVLFAPESFRDSSCFATRAIFELTPEDADVLRSDNALASETAELSGSSVNSWWCPLCGESWTKDIRTRGKGPPRVSAKLYVNRYDMRMTGSYMNLNLERLKLNMIKIKLGLQSLSPSIFCGLIGPTKLSSSILHLQKRFHFSTLCPLREPAELRHLKRDQGTERYIEYSILVNSPGHENVSYHIEKKLKSGHTSWG